jgi:hypothetical protein
LLEISTWASGADQYGLKMTARTRLVRTVDGVTLAADEHHYLSPSLPLAEWGANNGAHIHEVVSRGLDYMSADIAGEYFAR